MYRRKFLKNSTLLLPLFSCGNLYNSFESKLFFEIGLAQWSFNRAIKSGEMDNLDFVKVAKEKFDIKVVEYVNQFFFNKAKDKTYLKEMLKISDDLGVKNYLIMIDDEGDLGDTNKQKRLLAIENHKKWVEAANVLGCDNIRVNAQGFGSEVEVAKSATESLSLLGQFSKPFNIDIIVENHGGYSSNAKWLVDVIKNTKQSNVGTLPDFGNFCVKSKVDQLSDWGSSSEGCEYEYDRYLGVEEMMPFARSVSAKSYEFDDDGNSIEIDYYKMLKIIKDFGYNGYISIEYEGEKYSEYEGILLTKKLLEKAGRAV
mgnify:FL=1|tara:strand:- start:321 stop:1262 length:942 start_codon:yes stop_codon:yes gene_type:complete